MWMYDKKLEYPILIKNPDPALAKLIITQYGGPDANKLLLTREIHLMVSVEHFQLFQIEKEILSIFYLIVLLLSILSVWYSDKRLNAVFLIVQKCCCSLFSEVLYEFLLLLLTLCLALSTFNASV